MWRFDTRVNLWLKATPQDGTLPPAPVRRFATLNVLSDVLRINILNGNATLQHKLRYQHILCLFQDLDADVLCLNEVSPTFLKMLKGDPHVRLEYFLSSVEFGDMSDSHYGNVVMCKSLPELFFMIPQPLLLESRKAVLVGFLEANIAFCATHLQSGHGKAAIRKGQLHELAEEVAKALPPGNKMDVVILGDLNFHSETENACIPTGYVDLWTHLRHAPDKAAATLTSETNAMVSFVAPQFLLPVAMRLDRVLLLQHAATTRTFSSMRVWANKKLYPDWWMPWLPRPLHAILSWPQCIAGVLGFNLYSPLRYIFPSDHFGLCVECCALY